VPSPELTKPPKDGITNGLGASSETGKLFGVTTAGYTKADIHEQNFRMGFKEGDIRFLNIFRMDKNKDIIHQIAAAARGGPLKDDPKYPCPTFPCEKRFDDFFARFADKNGRIYAKQLGDIAGHIFKNGFHGVAAKTTLFSITQGFTGREYPALAGWLAAFSVKDSEGKRFLPLTWARTMVMHGVFPSKWKKRTDDWGSMDVFLIINCWRLNGVAGLSATLKAQSIRYAHLKASKKMRATYC